MNPAVYRYMLPLHYILLSYLFKHTLLNLLQTNTWSVLSPTGVGIDWLWLLLSWPCDWNAHWRLVDAVVVLIKERDTLRDVVGPRSVTVAVKVRREKGIIRPLHSVLVSWPFSQTVRTSSSGQVAHECVVLCRQAGRVWLAMTAYLLASKEKWLSFLHPASHQSLCGGRRHTVHPKQCHTGSSIQCTLFYDPVEGLRTCCPPPVAASIYSCWYHGQSLGLLGGRTRSDKSKLKWSILWYKNKDIGDVTVNENYMEIIYHQRWKFGLRNLVRSTNVQFIVLVSVVPSVVLRLTQRRRVPSRTSGGLQKQLKDPAVFTHTPFSQTTPIPHSS